MEILDRTQAITSSTIFCPKGSTNVFEWLIAKYEWHKKNSIKNENLGPRTKWHLRTPHGHILMGRPHNYLENVNIDSTVKDQNHLITGSKKTDTD